MDYLVNGGKAYAIKGGIQIDSCEILTNTNYNYKDIPPSIKARLRDDKDKSATYMESLFGYTFTIKNAAIAAIPSDDTGRTVGLYTVYKFKGVEAYEVSSSTGGAIVTACAKTSGKLEVLKSLYNCLSVPDITSSQIDIIIGKIDSVWSEVAALTTYASSLTQGGTGGLTVTASGFIAPGSAVYTYLPKYSFGTLKFKVLV